MYSEENQVKRVKKVAETAETAPPEPQSDKCDGHCIHPDPGTQGHHDNREPLY